MRRALVALLTEALLISALLVGLDAGPLIAGIVFAVVLAGGYALLCYCCRGERWEFWRFVLFGSFTGALCALPYAGGPHAFGFLLAMLLLVGATFGLLFWFAAIWRNANLTCPKAFCLPCGTIYRVARSGRALQPKNQSK